MPEHPTQNGLRSRIVNHRATSYALLPVLAWWITLVMLVITFLGLNFVGGKPDQPIQSLILVAGILAIGPGLVLGLLLAYVGEGVDDAR